MKNQNGQGMLIAIMILGVFLATILIFGASRQRDLSNDVKRLETGQIASEVFNSAAKIIAQKYSNEAACDPDRLEAIINSFANLGAANTFGLGSPSYSIAAPGASTAAEKQGLCATATGCRQFVVLLENMLYVVTVGLITSDANALANSVCARDAIVKLKLTIAGTTFVKRINLTNICSYQSCKLTAAPTYATGFYQASFTSNGATDGYQTTTACTGAALPMPSRTYGSLTNSTSTVIDEWSLRAARIYLDTGGNCSGETELIYNSAAGFGGSGTSVTCGGSTVSNLACTVNESASQCRGTTATVDKCIPALDLNKDKFNNDADIAILENYLRGYLVSLPVIQLN